MAVINVPKPPKSAFNKNRRLSTLLEWQIYHAQEAELSMPVGHTTDVYVNTIKTEGEAADYIRQITEKVHELHGVPIPKPKKKTKTAPRGRIAIAAAAEPVRKRPKTTRTSKTKSRRRKS